MTTHAELAEAVRAWFATHLPEGMFTGPVTVTVDREEISVVGPIPAPGATLPEKPEGEAAAETAVPEEGVSEEGVSEEGAPENAGAVLKTADKAAPDPRQAAAVLGAVKAFREGTRQARIGIAREAEQLFNRKVSWGVECAGRRAMFTTYSLPVMTRLRQPERQVLDTLVDAGVARSRSDAVAWCVRLVGRHTEDWLGELRAAVEHVERVRGAGPE